jgi:hypothetical protein
MCMLVKCLHHQWTEVVNVHDADVCNAWLICIYKCLHDWHVPQLGKRQKLYVRCYASIPSFPVIFPVRIARPELN